MEEEEKDARYEREQGGIRTRRRDGKRKERGDPKRWKKLVNKLKKKKPQIENESSRIMEMKKRNMVITFSKFSLCTVCNHVTGLGYDWDSISWIQHLIDVQKANFARSFKVF